MPRTITLERSRDEQVFILLHFLLALSLPLVLMFLLGCDPKYKGEKVDYGPETPADEINKAIAEGVGDIDPTAVKPGEFVHYAKTQSINNDPVPMIMTDTSRTVTSRQETATEISVNIVQHEVTYQTDGTNSTVSREFPIVFEKQSATSSSLFATGYLRKQRNELVNSAREVLDLMVDGLSSKSGVIHALENSHITYHNFKSTTEEAPPPPAVQKQDSCGRVSNCRLRIHKISFDQVFWEGDVGTRVSIEAAVSPDVPAMGTPYYGVFYSQCVSQTIPVGESSTRVLVKQCTNLEDFKFGSDTPAATPTPSQAL
jgi:hypothetical protein